MDILREQLIKALNGGQAFTPFKEALEGIAQENRNKKVNENTHTIWQELEHIRIAQEDILQYMIDPNWKSPRWPDEYWPRESKDLSEKTWQKSYEGFFNDLHSVIQLVKNPEIDLLEIIPHTENHTYLREILLIIEHNAYHIGKIVDIRKSLNNWG
ncbi:MAG: DinB family protein [Ignavibacteriaceae bacterium]|jgi:hypothetical protein